LWVSIEIRLFISGTVPEAEINSLDSFIGLIEKYRYTDSSYWFRGQSNFDWKLNPSILRDLNRDTSFVINHRWLKDRYDSIGLLVKYRDIFNGDEVDYSFLSLMQHSIAYSPLMDFTKNFVVAMSFALSNREQLNTFENNDAAIYVFSMDAMNFPDRLPMSIDEDIDKYNVLIVEDKKTYSTATIAEIIKHLIKYRRLTASISKTSDITNDRMKYQQGTFVLFNKFVQFDKHSVPLDRTTGILKFRVRKEVKKEIYNYIKEHYPYYSLNNLMNPYQYFNQF